nr:MAG TPA: hypothetical protein [Caudoviricetes sp.]
MQMQRRKMQDYIFYKQIDCFNFKTSRLKFSFLDIGL